MKKLLIVLMWIFGLLLSTYSVITFSIRIPELDARLTENRDAIENFYIHYQHFITADYTALLSLHFLILLNALGFFEEDFAVEEVKEKTSIMNIASLQYIHTMATGSAGPSQDLLNTWSTMVNSDFQSEKEKYLQPAADRLGQLYAERDFLQQKEKDLTRRAVLMQIFGLFCGQLATILEFWTTKNS